MGGAGLGKRMERGREREGGEVEWREKLTVELLSPQSVAMPLGLQSLFSPQKAPGYLVQELTEFSVPYLFTYFLAAVQYFYCGPLWYCGNVITTIFSIFSKKSKYFPLHCSPVQALFPRNLTWHRILLIFLF